MRIRLGVNVDHVATLRQQRNNVSPDPVEAAYMAERAGADQITVHLRADRRHIQVRDLEILSRTIRTKMNLEMAITDEMRDFALQFKPGIVTLVPEHPEEQTTEGGLDLRPNAERNTAFIRTLQNAGITISIFVDPNREQIQAAHDQGATHIELHTGDFSAATTEEDERAELHKLQDAATFAASLGLIVAAGHGLNLHNVHLIKTIPEVEELNIGHALVAHAVFVGFAQSVRDFIHAMKRD